MPKQAEGSRKVLLAATALTLVGREVSRRVRQADLRGQVALVTGGSRGLGLLVARELADEGCRLVLCARDGGELARAREDLERRARARGSQVEVLTVTCDVGEQAQVADLVKRASGHFGQIDVLVNNAGIIAVGPLQDMTAEDFEAQMRVNFWGTVYPTLAVLPQMRRRRQGRIVNVTSIGGLVSVPHLVPYSCSKFAAVAFSRGLRAELARDGITVTTIAPSPLRTGSHLNALFKGRREAEYAAFSLAASLPLISMDAERAARQIVGALKRGESERVLALSASVLAHLYALAPGTATDVLGVASRVAMPAPTGGDGAAISGRELSQPRSRAFAVLTTWGRSAARRFQFQHSSDRSS